MSNYTISFDRRSGFRTLAINTSVGVDLGVVGGAILQELALRTAGGGTTLTPLPPGLSVFTAPTHGFFDLDGVDPTREYVVYVSDPIPNWGTLTAIAAELE
jgi:hypothetical protein